MNTYISGTPEITTDTICEVVDFLSSINGPINFIPLSPVSKKWTEFRKSNIEKNEDSYIILSELKQIATLLRMQYSQIEDDDLVVVLTSITLNFIEFNSPKKWFSHYNGNDIYIRTYNWSKFTNNRPYLAISHQVLENSLQILNGNISGKFDYYHQSPEGGCINAFCSNELEVEYKINTGKICNSCQLSLMKNQVLGGYVIQIKNILLKIATTANSLNSDYFENNDKIIRIDRFGQISIDDYELELDDKPKAFYLFFILSNNRGFTFNELSTNKDLIIRIYSLIKKNASERVIYNFFGFDIETSITIDEKLGKIEDVKIVKKKPFILDTEFHSRMRKIRNEIKTEISTNPSLLLTKIFEVKNIGEIGKAPKYIFSYPRELIFIDQAFLNSINRTS
jgi:hypothetical protein